LTLNLGSKLYYTNYNQYEKDIKKLWAIKSENNLGFKFSINKIHFINFSSFFSYQRKDNLDFYQEKNQLAYRLSLTNFNFNAVYYNSFDFNDGENAYHKFNIVFYWQFPKVKILKYKTSFDLKLEHSLVDQNKLNLKLLSSINLKLELIIDFNKLELKELLEEENDSAAQMLEEE
jgi:hypothetical protein